MRLAAVFIEDHDYDFGGYTLNFGGNFYYDLKFGDGSTRISRKRNENYINNFFDKTNTVTNVSAIVGSNGSGKTTTLYDVLKLLNEDFKSGFAFWEKGDTCYFNHYNLRIPSPFVFEGEWGLDNFLQTNKEVGTIYFSPYLDHKAGATGIDISADRYLREDLVNIDSTYDANSKVVISERLKRADYKRFINFQKSDFSKKIKKKYGFLNDDLYRVVFTRHNIDANTTDGINFENTPTDFQSFLNKLFLHIREDYDSLDRQVTSEEQRYELNKKQFKNILLMDVFCLLIKLMERRNTFLKEGHFNDIQKLSEFLKTKPDALSKLKFWLNNYNYSKWDEHPLPNQEVIDILDFLYDYIDKLTFSENDNYLNWSSKSLFFKEEKLNELLDINERLLVSLNKYYLQKGSKDKYEFQSISDLQHFVNLEFAARKLSSGETALLNLYSRIYDYFSRHVINYQVVKKESYYLLFLDEADLGYHPSWKKSFVKSIIEFSIDFFETLGSKVQIIFTTHDAISLSDIPNSNVIYLDFNSPNRILSNASNLRPRKTFGANVHDLLAHSFFLENGLMGDFAKEKIEETINWLNSFINEKKVNPEVSEDIINHHESIIKIIDEPLLNYKLTEMFQIVFPNRIDKENTAKQIRDLAQKAGLNLKDLI
jgi:hypothetical protein